MKCIFPLKGAVVLCRPPNIWMKLELETAFEWDYLDPQVIIPWFAMCGEFQIRPQIIGDTNECLRILNVVFTSCSNHHQKDHKHHKPFAKAALQVSFFQKKENIGNGVLSYLWYASSRFIPIKYCEKVLLLWYYV